MRKIMPKRDTVMVHRIVDARWVAPPGVDAHRHLALIRHAERLFSFSDLLACTPPDEIDPGLAAGHVKPQEWWDDLASRRPKVADRIAARCHPQDFGVLDLYAMDVSGSA